MAGTRQHIIPKFLLKGFASRKQNEQVFTWVYRKDTDPFEANIKNINVEKGFYDSESGVSADNVITRYESERFSPVVESLRTGQGDIGELRDPIAEFVAHFSIRTKFIRSGFEDLSSRMLEGYKKVLTDGATAEKLLSSIPDEFLAEQVKVVIESRNENQMLDSVLEMLDSIGMSEEALPGFIAGLTRSYLMDEQQLDEVKEMWISLFSEGLSEAIESVPESIKKGHVEALYRSVIPEPRFRRFRELGWRVVETESPLILGDVGCVFEEEGNRDLVGTCEIDKVKTIYLPISQNQLLIGPNDDEIRFDVAQLNDFSARISSDQFVASENSADLRELCEVIGTRSFLVKNEDVEKELEEVRQRIDKFFE